MSKLREKFKNSYFVVNKIYLFLVFILLLIEDAALGFYYFLISLFIYTWRILGSKIPMDVNGDFPITTYIYKKTDDRNLKLDVYHPNKCSGKYPLVFFCHGGGWISGFRNQPNNVSWCKFLASKGFTVVSIDYRYGYTHDMEDILSDYTDALEYAKENNEDLSIDKDNIVLMGLSAGGHLALLYSTYYTFNENLDKMNGIKGVVAYYPPTDLNQMLEFDNKSLFAKFATIRTLKELPPDDDNSYNKNNPYDYYSPINWLSKRMVPTLLVHGREDKTVPYKSSLDFAERLKFFNIDYTFLSHKKGGHSFDTKMKDRATIHIVERTVNYIKKLMK